MSFKKRAFGSAFAVASLAGVGAGTASAAAPVQAEHLTAQYSSQSGATSALNTEFSQLKAAGATMHHYRLDLLSNGKWQAEIFYEGKSVLPGDLSAGNFIEISDQTTAYIHSASGFSTRAEALNHAQWTINQINAHPNDKQLLPRGTVEDNVYFIDNAHQWGYSIAYNSSSGRLFAEDMKGVDSRGE